MRKGVNQACQANRTDLAVEGYSVNKHEFGSSALIIHKLLSINLFKVMLTNQVKYTNFPVELSTISDTGFVILFVAVET